jgi:hypothetical protein
LLQEGAFDEVVRDAHFVFHTASPFFIKAEKDAQKELIDPALKGTQVSSFNVLLTVHGSEDAGACCCPIPAFPACWTCSRQSSLVVLH